MGLSVGRGEDGVTTVSQVLPAGPAAAAGIAVGDRLLRIGEDDADRLPVTEVVARLRGREGAERQAGSEVVLELGRGEGGVREVRLRRALLDSQQVTVEHLAGGVVRIAVRAFTSGVAEQVRAAVRGARAGVVLDLRGNSGGLVEEAVGTAGVFLDGGPVGSYQDRGGTRELTAPPGGDQRTPLVVLVDGGTMSAAELLTGALQDRGRAVVAGTRTFGKGTVQQPSRSPTARCWNSPSAATTPRPAAPRRAPGWPRTSRRAPRRTRTRSPCGCSPVSAAARKGAAGRRPEVRE